MTKKCTKIYNALAQPLFFLLNLLFSDVAVAVVVILIKLPITFYKRNEWDCDGGFTRDYNYRVMHVLTAFLQSIVHICLACEQAPGEEGK